MLNELTGHEPAELVGLERGPLRPRVGGAEDADRLARGDHRAGDLLGRLEDDADRLDQEEGIPEEGDELADLEVAVAHPLHAEHHERDDEQGEPDERAEEASAVRRAPVRETPPRRGRRPGRRQLAPALTLSLIHISEPKRQAENSYAVFCLKKKKYLNVLPTQR